MDMAKGRPPGFGFGPHTNVFLQGHLSGCPHGRRSECIANYSQLDIYRFTSQLVGQSGLATRLTACITSATPLDKFCRFLSKSKHQKKKKKKKNESTLVDQRVISSIYSPESES